MEGDAVDDDEISARFDLIDEAPDVLVVALQRHRGLHAVARVSPFPGSTAVARRDGSRLCCFGQLRQSEERRLPCLGSVGGSTSL